MNSIEIERMTVSWLNSGHSITELPPVDVSSQFFSFRKAMWSKIGCTRPHMPTVALQAKAVGNVKRLIHRKGKPTKGERNALQ